MRKTLGLAGAVMIAMAAPNAAQAVDIHLFTAGAMQEAERELAAEFAYETGNKVIFTVGTVGQIQAKLKEGAPVDIIVVSTPALEQLEKAGAVKVQSGIALGRIGIGVGAKEGAPMPDISTPEKFRDAMLKARAVTYMDPAVGASSGIATAKIMKDLGIDADMAKKTKLTQAGYSADRVASGEVEYAIQNMSEIMPVKGVKLVGPLPPDLQVFTAYSAGLAAKSANPREASDFVRFMRREAADHVWTDAGVEPAGR
jgi:molybdate transport system substrate-binding protein